MSTLVGGPLTIDFSYQGDPDMTVGVVIQISDNTGAFNTDDQTLLDMGNTLLPFVRDRVGDNSFTLTQIDRPVYTRIPVE